MPFAEFLRSRCATHARTAGSGRARVRLGRRSGAGALAALLLASSALLPAAVHAAPLAGNDPASPAASAPADGSGDRIANLERLVENLRGETLQQRDQAKRLREELNRAEAAVRWQWAWTGATVLLCVLVAWLVVRLVALRRSQGIAWALADQAQRESQLASAMPPLSEPPPSHPAPAMAVVHSGFQPSQRGSLSESSRAWPPPSGTVPATSRRQAAVEQLERADRRDPSPSIFGALPDVPTRAVPMAAAPLSDARFATQPLPPSAVPSMGPVADASLHAVTIDELLDLEQQVDFFIALGQAGEAVELLTEHLRHTGGGSPLPYLKLLELYRDQDQPDEYDRLRQQFNQRFNGHVPAWGSDLESGRPLEADAPRLAQLQDVWSMPSAALAVLEGMIFAKDHRQPLDVPAFRDALLLYAVARDLQDGETARVASPTGEVDLLLPLDLPSLDDTQPLPVLPPVDRSTSVDIDLNLDLASHSIFDPLAEAGSKPLN